MIDFDDANQFLLVHHFVIPTIYTWGNKDRDKRENIRKYASRGFPDKLLRYKWCGFRIKVERSTLRRPLDIENVPKLVIDAFSDWQINKDKSRYPQLGLFPDDNFENVRAVYIDGVFIDSDTEKTEVWIFGKK